MTEDAPVQSKTKVMITFLKDENKEIVPKERVLDGLKGLIEISDDFDEPLDDLKDYM